MSNDPLFVSLTKVADFLQEIGLDPVDVKDLKSVHFDPGCLTVVRYRRDAAGKMHVAGNTATTETTTIRIVDGPQREAFAVDVSAANDPEPRYVVGER